MNKEGRIKIRRETPRPYVTCALKSNYSISCADCQEMPTMDVKYKHNGKTYVNEFYCIGELAAWRYFNVMKRESKNIGISWSQNYKVEQRGIKDEDEEPECDNVANAKGLGDRIGGEEAVGEQVDIHGNENNGVCREELPTEATVGEIYGGKQ